MASSSVQAIYDDSQEEFHTCILTFLGKSPNAVAEGCPMLREPRMKRIKKSIKDRFLLK